MWLLTSIALASSLSDATGLYALAEYDCATRGSEPDVCWKGARQPAVLRSDLDIKIPRPPFDALQLQPAWEGWCALSIEHDVYCIGNKWRIRMGMPPGTPKDAWVRVETLAGVTSLAGRCGLRECEVRCATGTGLMVLDLPTVLELYPPGCAKTVDGVYCWYPPRKVGREELDGANAASLPALDGVVGLYRRADGQVMEWVDGALAKEVAIPPVSAGSGSVLRRGSHGCALAPGGQVACWGNNDAEAVTPGGARALYWRRGLPAMEALPKEPPWKTESMAPLDLSGVDELVGDEDRGCALRKGALFCFGVFSGSLVLPERSKLEGVQRVSFDSRLVALLEDGDVMGWTATGWELLFQVTGASDVWVGRDLICASSPGNLWCWADEADGLLPIEIEGEVETRGGRICSKKGCLSERAGESRNEVYRVERGW